MFVRKSDLAWEELFDRFSISDRVAQDGYFDITSENFKQLHFEPRLLTKMDHSHLVPKVMRDHNLGILTTSNSQWRIGPYEVFASLPRWEMPSTEILRFQLPGWLESINEEGITGEGGMVNAAYISGILNDFFDEEALATITGKGRSGSFQYSIKNFDGGSSKVDVKSAQIEIDAGFETKEALYLLEAKKHLSLDFNVRQLYYPYRTWVERINKKVRPVFLTLANDVFDLLEYTFVDEIDYSSIQLVRHKRYMLGADKIYTSDIDDIIRNLGENMVLTKATGVPFPQADDLERLLDLIEFIGDEPKSADEIATNYEFHPRQADYYFNAARFLGLCVSRQSVGRQNLRTLTDLGSKVLSLNHSGKRKYLARLVLQIPEVKETYLLLRASNEKLRIEQVERLVALSAANENISGTTIHRRSQTILAWAKWLKSITSN